MAATATERPPLVVLADGTRRTRPLADDEQVALWSRCLHAGAAGLVELVAGRRLGDGSLRMRSRSDPRRYPPACDIDAFVALARGHRRAGEELFATPLARRRPRGGVTCIARGGISEHARLRRNASRARRRRSRRENRRRSGRR